MFCFFFVNGSGGHSSEAELCTELSAMRTLRQQLQEGIERNQQLHQSLLGHAPRHIDNLTSSKFINSFVLNTFLFMK